MRPRRLPAFLRSPRFWVIAVVVVAGLHVLTFKLDIETVRTKAAQLNGGIAFLLLTVLPLVGFPVSVLHVAAGIRFGVPLGLGLVWVSILLQLLASHGLVHWRRRFFERHLKRFRDKVPPGSHVPVTVFTILVPGVPYFAKNYTVPLLGVPLRVFLSIALPMHAARSALAVLVGAESQEFTPARVWMIVAYGVLILAVSWWVLRRLQTKLGVRPPKGSGRKQRA